MKISDLVLKLNANVINLSEDITLSTGYAGDFLSNVMGKAPENSAWFTVMGNVNVAAVASLAGVGVIVICEGTDPDTNLINAAKMKNINIVTTKLDIYSAVKLVADSLGK